MKIQLMILGAVIAIFLALLSKNITILKLMLIFFGIGCAVFLCFPLSDACDDFLGKVK